MTLAAIAVSLLLQSPTLTPAEAKSHIGQQATVCGRVVSARWASMTNGPTFLKLDVAYPKPLFTVVILEGSRSKFNPPPEEQFKEKSICVTGMIREFQGRPEIVVSAKGQIAVGK